MGFLAALTRRRLLGGAAGALALGPRMHAHAGTTSTAVAAAGSGEASTSLRMALVLEVFADLASPVILGEGAEGTRRLLPVTGGRFEGPGLRGEVLPDGGEWQLAGPDGVIRVEARYTLAAVDGSLLAVTHRGLLAPRATDDPGPLRTVPEFEVPRGPHDWLNRSVLVGSRDASRAEPGRVRLRVFRVA